ncbi:hypothetical protein PL84_03540 [Vibrio anguillarum]|uniref:hypothetical protein n=1 Tax=Vibrio anguillarum TaxID=55601 RepID=UPI00097E2A28|nr:hypothetical protein [Vibrio anguillarum]MBT2909654.1 hypothetical protein [Vibrio anguillarum]MBT2942495.1 hypothetical protein [Vibrio anguillarum]MBT2950681.1 hypothetical protein [Vibrio anguillarum]MBT2979420.1 hypothetical protein [Vibrio anguillarum]
MNANKSTVATVLQAALNPVRFQLGIAADKTEGIANTSVNAAITLLEQVEQMTLEQYNLEVDDFNALYDELEETREALSKKEKDYSELSSNLDELELKASQAIAEAENDKAKAKITQANVKEKMAELKRLQEMQPEQMKARIADLRRKADERQKIVEEQRLKIRELKQELADTQTKKSVLLQSTTALTEELNEARSRLMFKDGDVLNRVFAGTDGILKCYIHVFEYGLSFRPESNQIKIINDLNWYYEVKTNHGLNITVSVTDWLQPFYPPCDFLADRWPTDIHDALHELIVSRVELSHPHLVERMEWAKESYLEDTDIDPKHLEILNNAGFHSLYSVLHVPSYRLLAIVKDKAGDAAKGFGDAAVKQIYAKLDKRVEQWKGENENWVGLTRQPKAA